jgi:hypothetical protein
LLLYSQAALLVAAFVAVPSVFVTTWQLPAWFDVLRMSPACTSLALEQCKTIVPLAASTLASCLQDSGTAKKLAFAREVNTRCITLEGDDFNPGGTLTGGSRNKGGSVLARLHELAEAEAQLAAAQGRLAQAQAALQGMSAASQQHKR